MLNISYGNQTKSREQILLFVQEQKTINPNYRVIDVGGSMFGWSEKIADVIVDINSTRPQDFKFNISNDWEWQAVLEYVDQHGKFDYAICTHTLEDIVHPGTALRNLPKIAKAGVITMPTINAELSRIENKQWLGYIHHRHIFDYEGDTIVYASKLSFIESLLPDGFNETDMYREIRFQWKDNIVFRPFMNDYLGPDATTVLNNYREFVFESIKKSQTTIDTTIQNK
jgi:hypothetical protein